MAAAVGVLVVAAGVASAVVAALAAAVVVAAAAVAGASAAGAAGVADVGVGVVCGRGPVCGRGVSGVCPADTNGVRCGGFRGVAWSIGQSGMERPGHVDRLPNKLRIVKFRVGEGVTDG